MSGIRYVHTNLVARDWQLLARFYMDVFDCEPAGPERDQSGQWLDDATGVERAHLRGRHLRLPGHGERGPTLEIFTYDELIDQSLRPANQVGYGHLAFEVADVAHALRRLIDHGGEPLGQVATTTVPGVGELEVTYARDPEGNVIELQSWR